MHAHPGPRLFAPIVGSVLLALVLILLWAALSEAIQGAIVLLGTIATVTLYGILYVAQRRRHW